MRRLLWCVCLIPGLALADVPSHEVLGVWRTDAFSSWYGPGFAGRTTSCGQVYNPLGLTAASTTLPCGTELRLTNTGNGRQVQAVVTDRGPFVRGRTLDVSRGVARALGFERQGLAHLRVEILR